jgi:hypothetical protein
MAALLLLVIAGTAVVADLVLENTRAGVITVLGHPITGYRDGLFLAMAAALGPPAAARTGPSALADRQVEPIYEAARRAAPLRSSAELSVPLDPPMTRYRSSGAG